MPNQLPIHDRAQLGTLPEADRLDAAWHWQRLIDAGLIGNPQPTPPDVAANRARWDALFRDVARSRRRR